MKKRVFALLLAAAALTSSATGCSSQGDTSDAGNTSPTENNSDVTDSGDTAAVSDTQFSTIFTLDRKTIYNNGNALIDVSDPDKPVFLNVKQEIAEESSKSNAVTPAEPLPSPVALEQYKSVLYGNEAISTYRDEAGKLYHYDMTDQQAVVKEVLYENGAWTSELRKKLGASVSDEDAEYVSDMVMLQSKGWTDGGDRYVYFYYVNTREYYFSWSSVNYIVGRFAKDGKGGVELMDDDIRANGIAVKDGYIYYADTGYVFDGQNITVDKDRTGIYKVKTDGTDKEKLVSVKAWGEEDKYVLDNSAARLEIIGDDLYYIAQDGGEETYLYRLSLGGGDPVKVVEDSVSDYWIDTKADTIFYFDGVMNVSPADGKILYSMPLSGGESKALFRKRRTDSYSMSFSTSGDYLYISDIDNYITIRMIEDVSEYDGIRPAGQRYNLKTGEMEYLRSYCPVKYEEGFLGVKTVVEMGSLVVEWVKYEDSPVEDGLTVYI